MGMGCVLSIFGTHNVRSELARTLLITTFDLNPPNPPNTTLAIRRWLHFGDNVLLNLVIVSLKINFLLAVVGEGCVYFCLLKKSE